MTGLDEVRRSAVISPDGVYRYLLTRRWAVGPLATFVMLNPSTADHETDDPTVRRCMGFARRWGLPGVRVVNLYAYRAASPVQLWTAADPVGPAADRWLQLAAAARGPLVAAWGAAARSDRVDAVLQLPGMTELVALGVTKDGHPSHPLYLPAAAALRPWPARKDAATVTDSAAHRVADTVAEPIPRPAAVVTLRTDKSRRPIGMGVCRNCTDGIVTQASPQKPWLHKRTGLASCRHDRARTCDCSVERGRCWDCVTVHGGGPPILDGAS